MEYILLLTACINPDGMPFTCLADVGVRKKQYIEALNFYLKNTTRKIVFVENSGTDISSSFKDFQHRIEFLCFDGILIREKGKGMERRLYWNMQWPNLNLLLMMC